MTIPTVRKEPLATAAADVPVVVHDVGKRFDVAQRQVRFLDQRPFGGRADDEVGLDLRVPAELFEEADAIDRPRRAGCADDQAFHIISLHHKPTQPPYSPSIRRTSRDNTRL